MSSTTVAMAEVKRKQLNFFVRKEGSAPQRRRAEPSSI